MNCCNDYGRCTQGGNCPARARQRPDPYPQPTAIDQPTRMERIGFWVAVLVTSCISVAVISVAAGYAWERWIA